MIDYPALVGAFSNELETRLQVGLQATWSKKGERIIPAGNGRTWIHTLNPTRYPAMNAEHIARIAYGERYEAATTDQRRKYRYRAGKAMNRLLAAGFAEVQCGADDLPRYLPGKQWIGRSANPKLGGTQTLNRRNVFGFVLDGKSDSLPLPSTKGTEGEGNAGTRGGCVPAPLPPLSLRKKTGALQRTPSMRTGEGESNVCRNWKPCSTGTGGKRCGNVHGRGML